MVRVLVKWTWELTELYQNSISSVFPPSPPPPLHGGKIKHKRIQECSETTLYFTDILFHVHEKSENKVEKDEKNLFVFHEFWQIIFHNPPPRSAHQSKPEKQIFGNGRKQPNTFKSSLGNLLVAFMPLDNIKILKLPPFEWTIKSENTEWPKEKSNLSSRLCEIYHWISPYGQGQIIQKYGVHINYVDFWLL